MGMGYMGDIPVPHGCFSRAGYAVGSEPACPQAPAQAGDLGAITRRIHLPRWKSLRAHRKSSDLPSGDSLWEGIVSHRKRYSSHFPSLPRAVGDRERADPWMLSGRALLALGSPTWQVSSITRLGAWAMLCISAIAL